MPASSPTLRRSAARAGAAARWGHASVNESRRDLAAERIASYVERVLAEAPPLTNDQRARLSMLLNGPASAGSAAA
jgi:hypothetical protein